MSTQEYLNQFKTKEEVKTELARLQRNIQNIGFARYDYWRILWNKKRNLVDKFNNEFCQKYYHMDNTGKQHLYYKEV